jgi:hypothetical protein
LAEEGQGFRLDEELDAAGDAWLASNEAGAFEGKDHLVD